MFIGYWGLHDGLTASTIFPWLHVMQQSTLVEEVVFCTIERDAATPIVSDKLRVLSNIRHVPLFSVSRKCTLYSKVSDFIRFPRALTTLAQQSKIHILFAHGAPAGALAYKVWASTKLPFFVSSFEPHAEYMAESGVWARAGLKYTFQKYWEEKQIENASGLMPVSDNYRHLLLTKGVPKTKVKTVPSTVKNHLFKFDAQKRTHLRHTLNWDESIIAIYVGKFGGLYYQKETFEIYKTCFRLVPNFKLIILSPQPVHEINSLLRAADIASEDVYINQVAHQEVAAYLSAADFAFATYKPGKSKLHLSPIKTGEYWANGLPVLLTEGVGDDSDIIKREGGGATFNLAVEGSVENALKQILEIVKDPGHREKIPELARKYRSSERLREAFAYFFGEPEQPHNT